VITSNVIKNDLLLLNTKSNLDEKGWGGGGDPETSNKIYISGSNILTEVKELDLSLSLFVSPIIFTLESTSKVRPFYEIFKPLQ
jgi:hypothetical protein